MKTDFKRLFRSKTCVLIPADLKQGIKEAIDVLGGGRILILVDKNIENISSLCEMSSFIEKSEYQALIHTVEVREPDVLWVDEQVKCVKSFCPDIVVGVGGGSLIDLAKAVSVLIYNEGSVADYQGLNLVKKPGAKKIMIPTTAGTGSEVTPGAVVLNRETGRKGAIGSSYVMPDIAILEPLLTLGMPPILMASTALDAITHCLESYVGVATNPFADMYAREGFRYLINNFSVVLKDPMNSQARLNMLIGSVMGGYAIFNTDTGASHSMSYPLGTYFSVPHGVANALLIPGVIEHNINGGCTRYAELYDLIDERDKGYITVVDKSTALLNYIHSLISKAELPENLKPYGINEENVADIADKGVKLKTALNNNPVLFEYKDALRILNTLI